MKLKFFDFILNTCASYTVIAFSTKLQSHKARPGGTEDLAPSLSMRPNRENAHTELKITNLGIKYKDDFKLSLSFIYAIVFLLVKNIIP